MAISENGMLNEYVDEDDDLYFINETHTNVFFSTFIPKLLQ